MNNLVFILRAPAKVHVIHEHRDCKRQLYRWYGSKALVQLIVYTEVLNTSHSAVRRRASRCMEEAGISVQGIWFVRLDKTVRRVVILEQKKRKLKKL